MAAYAVHIPGALRFRQLSFHPDVPSRSGGMSATGFEQVTVSGAGRWRATGSIWLTRETDILAYQSLITQLEGRAGTAVVPAPIGYRPKDVNQRWLSACATSSFSDGSSFFDESEFAQSDITHATLAAGASLGATQISLTLVDGLGPQPGHYFGIGQRLYRAGTVWRETEASPTQVRFWPPLREAATTGDRVILDRPVCLMRLVDDASGEPSLDMGKFGEPTLSFVEAL